MEEYANIEIDYKPLISNKKTTTQSKNINFVDEPLLWCGVLGEHYGHFVADRISRILKYKGMAGKLCFSITQYNQQKNNCYNWDTSPLWFKQIITFFGFKANDVFLVTQPIVARKLYIAPKSEWVNQQSFTSDSYLDLLDENSEPVPFNKKQGVYYISRVGLKDFLGQIAGETYLEKYLQTLDVNIVHPETLSVQKQIELYKNAKMLIFADGSAYHTLQLLGHVNCDVLILKRRKLDGGDMWIKNTLNPRCNTLKFSDFGGNVISGLAPFPIEDKDKNEMLIKLTEDLAICIYEQELFSGIESWLEKFGHSFKKVKFNMLEYFESVLKDYENHLKRECLKVQERYDYLNAVKKCN